MTGTIRTVKREIRVLGLDTCRRGLVFGAVVRGGLYLDGVIRHKLQSLGEQGLAKAILASKYYPELRVLMLHDPGHRVGYDMLEELVGLPVMEVSLSKRPGKGFSSFRSKQGVVFHRSRLAESVAERVLSLTWLYSVLPEPARIAHLISQAGLRSRARESW